MRVITPISMGTSHSSQTATSSIEKDQYIARWNAVFEALQAKGVKFDDRVRNAERATKRKLPFVLAG